MIALLDPIPALPRFAIIPIGGPERGLAFVGRAQFVQDIGYRSQMLAGFMVWLILRITVG